MKSYLFLAEGFEEIEAVAPLDITHRAGMDVKSVSITGNLNVRGANGIELKADCLIEDVDLDDALWFILPGGLPGASNLAECKLLADKLRERIANGQKVAAICASPAVVLASAGLLKGRKATCYPGFEDMLVDGGADHIEKSVVVDNNIITANGPGSALKFGYAIVANTLSRDMADQLETGMMAK